MSDEEEMKGPLVGGTRGARGTKSMEFKKNRFSQYSNEAIVKLVPDFVRLVETGTKAEDAVALLIPGIPPSKRAFVAQKFITNPILRELIAAEREKLIENKSQEIAVLNAEFVKTEYLDVYREARANGDRGNALRALDALGRHFGMFVERSESRLIIDGHLNVSHETIDADLKRLAQANGVIIEVVDDAVYEEVIAEEEEVCAEERQHGGQGTADEGPSGEGPAEG